MFVKAYKWIINLVLMLLGKKSQVEQLVRDVQAIIGSVGDLSNSYKQGMADGKLTMDEVLSLIDSLKVLMSQLEQAKTEIEALTKS